MPIVFPTSPTVGQLFTEAGRSWVWTGSSWDAPTTNNALQIPYGLEFIKKETGTAVNAITINDCFSSLYKNYRIIYNGTCTVDAAGIRLRAGGVDESAAIYRQQSVNATGASLTSSRDVNQTFWGGLFVPIGASTHNVFELSNPFETVTTSGQTVRLEAPAGNIEWRAYNSGINSTLSYTGFTLRVPNGTMTGTVSVYGYRLG
jgi:hypothetical protein